MQFLIRILGITLVALFVTSTLRADPSFGDQETALLNYLSAVSRYSPLEGAYSHGSIGATFGVGVENHSNIEANALQRHHLHMEETEANQNVSSPKIYFTKGSFLPVDFGFSIGATQDDHISMAGAHAQWSIFEGFRLPAVAVRASYNQLFGMKDAEMQSTRGDLVISTNIWSFFTIYGTTGIQRNNVTLNSASYFQYGLTTAPENRDYSKSWISKSHAIGLRALVIAPFLAATAEMQFDSNNGQSLAGKVSLDI